MVSLGAVQIAPYPDPFLLFKSMFKSKEKKKAISDAQVRVTYLLIDQIFAKCLLTCIDQAGIRAYKSLANELLMKRS